MEWREFSAKTVDDAVLEAAIRLGTTRDNIEYEVIFQGSSGFLGIGSKDAIIRARLKEEEEDILEEIKQDLKLSHPLERSFEKKPEKKQEKKLEKRAERPEFKKPAAVEILENTGKTEKSERPERLEKTERPFEKSQAEMEPGEPERLKTPLDDAVFTDVEGFLKKVFASMELEVELHVTVDKEDREVCVELSGKDMGVLIGKRGQTLDSLQYLTSLVANKGRNEYVRVKVDTENYRERRRETLENLAKNISFKVKRTKKPVTLEPMNPYERRVIHSALQTDKFVSTHSEGEEPYRHVVVTLRDGVRMDSYKRRNNNFSRNRNNHRRRER